jgi:hypothetical protein
MTWLVRCDPYATTRTTAALTDVKRGSRGERPGRNADDADRIRPDVAYLFTQVALEGLRWCKRHGVPSVLDNPNGGIKYRRSVRPVRGIFIAKASFGLGCLATCA